MKMKKYIFIILILLVIAPQVSMGEAPAKVADDTYTLIEPLPCITGVTKDCNAGGVKGEIDIKTYILYVYKFAIAISVFLAIIMIIWGGFSYITSEIPYLKTEAKGKIEGAVTGLVLVLVSYLILVTIDPRLVNIETTIPKVNMKEKDSAKESLGGYQMGLSDEFRRISAENQLDYMQENSRIDELREEMEGLKYMLNNGQIPADKIESTLEDIERLRFEIKDSKINQQLQLAENTALFQYSTALQSINNPKNMANTLDQYIAVTVPNTPNAKGFLPIDGLNAIQNSFNSKINNIKQLGADDKGNATTNYDKIQALEKQRDFFIAQVKTDHSTYQTIAGRYVVSVDGAYRTTTIDTLSKKISDNLAGYKLDLVNEEKIKASGLPKEQYQKIIQTRIDTINQALGVPVVAPATAVPPKP